MSADVLSDLLAPTTAPVPFVRDLAVHGDRTAIITAGGRLSYLDLAARVAATAQRLGSGRRLILLAGGNDLDALVTYLAALAAGHPVLLVPGDSPAAIRSLTDFYDPDVVVGPDEWWDRRATTIHRFHPDLALLLSTSGSTGSPKLVRLSHQNVQSNAESIAAYLGIGPDDRAVTTLPMHYCYGLSVIHSHLLRGAAVVLTDLSVADSCFWKLFGEAGGTSFAGVPYTFELLDRIGFADMALPSLRYVTQAGGRLAPERVAQYAALGRERGWDFYVMYGQTEATARMAYLPPHRAESNPEAIGVPIPGGAFHLEPLPDWPERDTGELVYHGPNVMLGYADGPADLALGRVVTELYTGDVARRRADGLYELIGRRSRFAKVAGVRIDPQRIEALLDRQGIRSYCVGGDGELLVTAAGSVDPQGIRRLVCDEYGLPPLAVRVQAVDELPRLPTGKPDYEAVRALFPPPAPPPPTAPFPGNGPSEGGFRGHFPEKARGRDRAGVDAETLCRLYADVLDRPVVRPDDSFVSLGGDSLSYVETSIRLEHALGCLPADWHTRSIRELCSPPGRTASEEGEPRTNRKWRSLDTSVAIRAVAIVLIVGTHAALFAIAGGAHLLIAVAGFNFARFHLTDATRSARVRHAGRSITRIVVPSVAVIGVLFLVTDAYGVLNVLLLNGLLAPGAGGDGWNFWFVEALAYILVTITALLAIPAVDRFERRHPLLLPLGLAAIGLIIRYDLLDLRAHVHLPSAVRVFWLFALGWAVAKAVTVPRRLLVTAATAATVPGFFADPPREAVVLAGFVLLIWLPAVPSLAVLNRIAGVLASASLYIYLVHWQVYPSLERSPLLATLACLAVGIVVAFGASRVSRLWSKLSRSPRT